MYRSCVKRLFDIALSGFSLVILSPVLATITVLVRVKLGSPVLFKQDRPGMIDRKTGKEKIFQIYKFRSMTEERDAAGCLLPDATRLTKFGRLLRSTSLDELPELINILMGDMSIVGPRPLAVAYLPYYTEKERHRHDVRPGLTGWAQVNGRNSIDWDEKFKYDLEYINRMSLLFDLKIIILTGKKVLAREGIGQGNEIPQSLHIERRDWLNSDGTMKSEYNK